MNIRITGIFSFLLVLVLIVMTAGNFQSELKEQMTKEDDKHFVLKARNLHNLSHVLGAIVFFLIPYLDKEFNNKSVSIVVLAAFALLVLGTIIYTINRAMTRIEYDNGQITYYFLDRVKVTGNINEINIDKCYNQEHPKNVYSTRLLFKDSTIVFNNGSFIKYQTTMKNAYKLEAILKKRGCFKYEKESKKQ